MKELEWIKETAEEIRKRRTKEPEEETIRRAEAGEVRALKEVIAMADRRGNQEEVNLWMHRFYEDFAKKISEGDGAGAYQMVYGNGPYVDDFMKKREAMQQQVCKLLEKQLEDGKEEARAYLDRCYCRDISRGKRKVEDAIDLWKDLAESGDAKAEWMLSSVYASFTDNEDAAYMWLEKSAKHGSAVAQHGMAESYISVDEEKNEYVGKQAKKAIHWLKKAAAQYDAPMGQSAILWLGDIYKFGCKEGRIPVNYKKAIYWYTLAAQYSDCFDKKDALIKLADCYRKSRGANRDVDKSNKMFEALVNEGLITDEEDD